MTTAVAVLLLVLLAVALAPILIGGWLVLSAAVMLDNLSLGLPARYGLRR